MPQSNFRISILVPLLSLLLLGTTTTSAKEDSAMVEDGMQISVAYELSVDGELIESNEGRDPLVYIQGGNQILGALESALEGMRTGDQKTVQIAAADGYGEVRQDAFQEVPLDMIPDSAREVGAVLQAENFPGPIRVAEVKEAAVLLDFNHPLAGKELSFDVTVLSVDEAPPAPAPEPPPAG